jgi:hypothetical protein
MTINRTNTLIALSMMIFLVAISNVEAGTTFRGIDKLQFNQISGANNDLVSPVLDRAIPFHIDVFDGFGRSGDLNNTRDVSGEGFHVSFVPTSENVAVGEVDTAAGIWSADLDYQTNNGTLSRTAGSTQALASVPWRVTPGLGDDYLVAADVVVADGSSVSLAYLGAGTGSDLDSAIGQLVVELTRTGDTINYVVDWFSANNAGGSVRPHSEPASLLAADLAAGVKVELGWKDMANGQDVFDLYVASSEAAGRVSGSMGLAIDVHGVGLELTDAASYFDSFTAAVPEPTSGVLMALGMLSLLGLRVRRDS